MRCSQGCSGTWSCLSSPENKHQEISLTKLGRLCNSQPLGPLVQLKPEDVCCLGLAMLEITQTTSQFSRTSQITLCGVTSMHTMMLRRTHRMKTEGIFFLFLGHMWQASWRKQSWNLDIYATDFCLLSTLKEFPPSFLAVRAEILFLVSSLWSGFLIDNLKIPHEFNSHLLTGLIYDY